MLQGFKQFILRGNVVDLAVGVVIGAAFTGIVNSAVKDILTPLVGSLGHVPDFSNLFFILNGSKFMYGDFLNSAVSFVIIAATVYFFVVLPINALVSRSHHEKPADPTTRKCPECLTEIPLAAKRCSACTMKVEL